MKKTSLVLLETLIRACYGKFNDYRIKALGMQKITELFQFQKKRTIFKVFSYGL